jgi:sec-independent protein translocase protein TatA
LNTLLFLNLGGGEVFVVILVALMFFGSDKLPEIAKGLGKGLREINDAKQQIQEEISKNTGGLKEEIEKHTSQIQSEIDNAGGGIRKRLDDMNNSLKDEGTKIEDTL